MRVSGFHTPMMVTGYLSSRALQPSLYISAYHKRSKAASGTRKCERVQKRAHHARCSSKRSSRPCQASTAAAARAGSASPAAPPNHCDSTASAVACRTALADEYRVLLVATVSLHQVAISPLAAVLSLGIIPYLHDLFAALVQAAGNAASGQWNFCRAPPFRSRRYSHRRANTPTQSAPPVPVAIPAKKAAS